MEGYAAIFAASRERKPAIVVRGVSDMTEKRDPASDKIRQPIAACHAAAFAIEVQLEEQARSEPLESYHAMLDRLWNERVLGAPNGVTRSRLASSIADLMAEEESLWLARARFEEAAADIEALIAAGILTPNASGLSIGFAHQTVFDYALARAFSRQKGRLSSYVLERQASIFLRPKVWAALTYLRSADMAAFDEEIGVIWGPQASGATSVCY